MKSSFVSRAVAPTPSAPVASGLSPDTEIVPTDLRSLVTPREELEARLALLPDLVRRVSRYGNGLAYYVANREIVHFHGDQRMDVRLTREVIRLRKAEGGFDQRVQTRGPSADWATVRVQEPSDVELGLSLVEEAIRANA
jgi:Family of unknown function (DUF5519)